MEQPSTPPSGRGSPIEFVDYEPVSDSSYSSSSSAANTPIRRISPTIDLSVTSSDDSSGEQDEDMVKEKQKRKIVKDDDMDTFSDASSSHDEFSIDNDNNNNNNTNIEVDEDGIVKDEFSKEFSALDDEYMKIWNSIADIETEIADIREQEGDLDDPNLTEEEQKRIQLEDKKERSKKIKKLQADRVKAIVKQAEILNRFALFTTKLIKAKNIKYQKYVSEPELPPVMVKGKVREPNAVEKAEKKIAKYTHKVDYAYRHYGLDAPHMIGATDDDEDSDEDIDRVEEQKFVIEDDEYSREFEILDKDLIDIKYEVKKVELDIDKAESINNKAKRDERLEKLNSQRRDIIERRNEIMKRFTDFVDRLVVAKGIKVENDLGEAAAKTGGRKREVSIQKTQEKILTAYQYYDIPLPGQSIEDKDEIIEEEEEEREKEGFSSELTRFSQGIAELKKLYNESVYEGNDDYDFYPKLRNKESSYVKLERTYNKAMVLAQEWKELKSTNTEMEKLESELNANKKDKTYIKSQDYKDLIKTKRYKDFLKYKKSKNEKLDSFYEAFRSWTHTRNALDDDNKAVASDSQATKYDVYIPVEPDDLFLQLGDIVRKRAAVEDDKIVRMSAEEQAALVGGNYSDVIELLTRDLGQKEETIQFGSKSTHGTFTMPLQSQTIPLQSETIPITTTTSTTITSIPKEIESPSLPSTPSRSKHSLSREEIFETLYKLDDSRMQIIGELATFSLRTLKKLRHKGQKWDNPNYKKQKLVTVADLVPSATAEHHHHTISDANILSIPSNIPTNEDVLVEYPIDIPAVSNIDSFSDNDSSSSSSPSSSPYSSDAEYVRDDIQNDNIPTYNIDNTNTTSMITTTEVQFVDTASTSPIVETQLVNNHQTSSEALSEALSVPLSEAFSDDDFIIKPKQKTLKLSKDKQLQWAMDVIAETYQHPNLEIAQDPIKTNGLLSLLNFERAKVVACKPLLDYLFKLANRYAYMGLEFFETESFQTLSVAIRKFISVYPKAPQIEEDRETQIGFLCYELCTLNLPKKYKVDLPEDKTEQIPVMRDKLKDINLYRIIGAWVIHKRKNSPPYSTKYTKALQTAISSLYGNKFKTEKWLTALGLKMPTKEGVEKFFASQLGIDEQSSSSSSDEENKKTKVKFSENVTTRIFDVPTIVETNIRTSENSNSLTNDNYKSTYTELNTIEPKNNTTIIEPTIERTLEHTIEHTDDNTAKIIRNIVYESENPYKLTLSNIYKHLKDKEGYSDNYITEHQPFIKKEAIRYYDQRLAEIKAQPSVVESQPSVEIPQSEIQPSSENTALVQPTINTITDSTSVPVVTSIPITENNISSTLPPATTNDNQIKTIIPRRRVAPTLISKPIQSDNPPSNV